MLGEHAGDVVIDHNDIIDKPQPLPREHADGGRAAADPHAAFGDAIDDGRLAAATRITAPSSIDSSTSCLLHSASSVSQVTRPSALLPPVR